MNFKDQIRRNSVALISLVVAITSLGYNTWRNEASESNRTQRNVAIEVLMQLGELQEVTWHHHYDKDFEDTGNLRSGWTLVLVIRDISQILDGAVPASATQLHMVWDKHSGQLDVSTEAKNAIIDAIEAVRGDALDLLQELD
jgi:hypothetical protein